MTRWNARSFALILGALAAGSLCAQPSYPSGTIYFNAADYGGPPVADAPYCAERRNVRVVTQPDGTQQTLEYDPRRICRDSAGRVRYEGPVFAQPGGPAVDPPMIEIRDPIAGARYVIYAVDKAVYRQPLRPLRTLHPPERMPFPADPAIRNTEQDLGTQTMEGLEVIGRRYILNATTTSEQWWSPDIGEFVLEKETSTVNGELTHRLISVTRDEPDPELFRLPPDYAVIDRPASFTILWGQPTRN